MARKNFQVDVIGYGDWQPPAGVRFLRLERNRRSFSFLARYFLLLIGGRIAPRMYDAAFWLKPEYQQAVRLLKQGNYNLIHANDWDSLPVAIEGSNNSCSRVVFDSHEYTPEQNADNLLVRLFIKPYKIWLLKKYMHQVDSAITVSEHICGLYKKNYGVTMSVVLNVQNYKKIHFKPVNLECIHIIHHGIATSGRYLEAMIDMIRLTDKRYHLNFMLIPVLHPGYMAKLKKHAKTVAAERVTFWDPVLPSEIVNFIQRFDLGLPLLKVRQMSHFYSLPNKFFQFIMAGLGVVVSPLPTMAQVIDTYAIGKISASQTAEDMASMLNALSADEINTFKRNSLKLARVYNAECEMQKLLLIYESLLADNST